MIVFDFQSKCGRNGKEFLKCKSVGVHDSCEWVSLSLSVSVRVRARARALVSVVSKVFQPEVGRKAKYSLSSSKGRNAWKK